ncbi:MAG TPA: tetratricopeptide repeat protein [Kofleriaceae bacterium]
MKALLGMVCIGVVACGGGQKAKPAATQASSDAPVVQRPDHAHGHDHGDAGPPALRLDQIATGAALLPELGTHTRPITTTSKEAQAYFDQGLRLIYGFNHDEAARSFAKAALLDPKCASCYWGLALVLGPNYNVPMLPDRFPAAWDALQSAQRNASSAKPVEQALISALAKRYPGPTPKDPMQMAPFNQAYADAMKAVAAKFTDDDDVQVMYAESLMDLNPWHLWTPDGKAAPNTDDIVKALETVLARSVNHPGANHYYIHAIEASPHPERAEPSADRLAKLIPNAGHIVHMPAHIYQRVGRYADASKTNQAAVAVDLGYMSKAPAWGYYPMYLVHNYGFLAYSSSMLGRSAESIEAARNAAKNFPPPMLEMMPGMDFFIAEPLLVMVRFGKWDQLLAEPRPNAKYQTLTGLWLHAHGMALAATGKLDEAAKDLAELKALRDAIPAEIVATINSAKDIVGLSAAILEADLASKAKDPKALELWAAAVALEDKTAYSEPADWFYPVRHYQGAALLAAKKYKDAEAVYRADLTKNPENGWALWGLAESLAKQGKKAEAAKVQKRFDKAWPDEDIKLTTTAYQ